MRHTRCPCSRAKVPTARSLMRWRSRGGCQPRLSSPCLEVGGSSPLAPRLPSLSLKCLREHRARSGCRMRRLNCSTRGGHSPRVTARAARRPRWRRRTGPAGRKKLHCLSSPEPAGKRIKYTQLALPHLASWEPRRRARARLRRLWQTTTAWRRDAPCPHCRGARRRAPQQLRSAPLLRARARRVRRAEPRRRTGTHSASWQTWSPPQSARH
mmetsp:Transcript_4591/g.18409  ORF Transcript_4591/g.18409 Transcript_4591/m.18409 type:complete len:212 (-) Transcript_4591:3357-3992(-)